MKIVKIITSLLVVIVSPVLCLGKSQKVQRVAEYFEDQNMVPARLTIKNEVVAEGGFLVESTEVNARLIQSENGRIIFHPVNGVIDGKAAKGVDLKDMEEVLEENEINEAFPFNIDLLEEVVMQPESGCEKSGGNIGCHHTFRVVAEGKDIHGEMWLDERFGLPLLVEWQIDSVPFEEDDLTVYSYNQRDEYRVTEEGDCFPISSLTKMGAEYSLLFFSKNLMIENLEYYYDFTERAGLPKQ